MRTVRHILEGIFARGAELRSSSLHDCPYLRDTILEKAEKTLRRLIKKEANSDQET